VSSKDISEHELSKLSPQQQRISSFCLEDKNNLICECEWEMPMHASLKVLQTQLIDWMQRFEIFRTQIQCLANGENLQAIFPQIKTQLEVCLCTDYPISDLLLSQKKAQLLRKVINQDNRRIGVLIYRMSEERCGIYFVAPSEIADLETVQLLAKSIANQMTEGDQGDFLQYADLSEWLNRLMDEELGKDGVRYWRKIECPTIAEQLLLGETKLKTTPHFNAVVTDEHLLPNNQNVNEIHFLSIWSLCIAKLSGSKKVTIGKLSSGRNLEELKDAIGNLSLILPVYCDLDWLESFSQFNEKITNEVTEKEEYQECFSWNRLKNASDSDAAPYCFYGFEYNDLDALTEEAAGIEWTKAIFHAEPCLLKCSIKKYNNKHYLSFSYHPDHYSSDIIEFLIERYIRVVDQILLDFDLRLSQLDFTLPWERKKQQLWNQTETQFEQILTYHQLFEKQVNQTPEHTAVIYEDQHFSYKQLNLGANQFARLLINKGVGKGDFLGLALNRSIDLVMAVLGILKAGAAYVPIDPEYPIKRINYIVKNSAIKLAIVNNQSVNLFTLCDTINIDEINQLRKNYPSDNLQESILIEQPAYTIYTSGSTGKPKGVVVSHQSLFNYITWASSEYNLIAGNGSLVHSSISFDLTVTSLLAPLSVGQSLILIPEKHGVEGLISHLSKGNDYTLLKITPSHLKMLNAALSPESMKNSVRVIVLGGESLSWENIEPWLIHSPETMIVNEYGPTEATVGCCVEVIDKYDTSLTGMVSIGRPIHNTKLHILDQWQNEIPIGVTGELYIEGMGLALEYLKHPNATNKAFISRKCADGHYHRLYRTGDLVKYHNDGRLRFIGRCDDQVKLRGYRIELGEIEAILQRQKGVEETIVRVVDIGTKENRKEVLVGYVVEANKKNDDLFNTLRQRLIENVPEYMIPSHWVALDSLPLNTHGKLDKEKLPLPEKTQAYVSPNTKTEKILVDLWQRILGVDKVGIEDNYFQLGGDSIRSIGLISAARELGITFSLNQLFSNPTIVGLIQEIDENNDVEEEFHTQPFEMIDPEYRTKFPETVVDAYPLTILQQAMIYHNQFYEEDKLYHDIFSYRLQIPTSLIVDSQMIQEAYSHILQRHPVLRTTFSLSEYDQPLQLVHQSGDQQSLTIKSLRDLNDEQQQIQIKSLISHEKEIGFDISKLPLVRCFIHLLSDSEIQFSISFHHSVIDGWSDAILLSELLKTTIRLLQGKVISDEPIKAKFSDFVKLELDALNNPNFEHFWANKLEGLNFAGIPPLEQSLQNKMTSKVHTQQILIGKSLTSGLKNITKEIGIPLKSVLLAVHMRALNLIAAQDDITTCLVSAGRPISEGGDQVLGLFINSIPLRIKFNRLRQSTWRKLIEETFKQETQCLKYRRYPYGKMKIFTGLDSVSDALFYFTDYHNLEGLYDQTGIKLLSTMPYERSSFPLVIHFNIDPDSKLLSGVIECDANQFTADQNRHYSELYNNLLKEICQSIDIEFDSLYGRSQRQALLVSNLPTSQPPIYYSDFIQWRKNHWLNQSGSEHLLYWKNRLSGSSKSIKLPLISKSLSTQKFVNKSAATSIEADLQEVVKSLCSQHNISKGLLFECLFSLLLSRHSNEKDILIRRVTHDETLHQKGAFTANLFSTMAVRTKIDNDFSFTALIKRCKQQSKQDNQHKALLFESLNEQMKADKEEDIPRCSIFLSFSNELVGMTDPLAFIYLPSQKAEANIKFDLWLSVNFEEKENLYGLNLVYNAALYSKSSVQLLIDGFALLLRQLGTGIDRNVYAYSILPPEQESKMLARSGRTTKVEPHEPYVHKMFERQVSLHPDKIAIVYQNSKLSYKELNQKANRLAYYLIEKREVMPGSIVGIFLNGSVDFVITLIALLKVRATFVPIDPKYPTTRISFMLKDAGLSLIVTNQLLSNSLPVSKQQILCVDDPDLNDELIHFNSKDVTVESTDLDSEQLAYVIYTSGSTGKPKGVMVKYDHFSGHISGMLNFYELSSEDRLLQFSAVGVDATQEQIFCSLASGACLCLSTQEIMQGSEFDRFCAEQGITVLDLPPAYISVLFEKNSSKYEYLKNKIRLLILGGERLDLQTYRRLNQAQLCCRVVNAYGPTETVITSLAYSFQLNQSFKDLPSVPIGRAMKGREIYVLNSSYALVPDGVSGELYIGGEYLSSGYLNRPDLTAESFIKNPISESLGDYLYKTGDIVRWYEGDNLCFIERFDNQVSIRGFRVELSEIESELCNHPLVKSVAVLLKSSQAVSEKLVAYVVRESTKDIDEQPVTNEFELSESLRKFMQGRVPDYMIPSFIVFLDALPLTSAGKIDREQFPELDMGTVDNTFIPPRNELESTLCAVFEKVLKIERVGINSHFFHLGGDSLASLQLVSQLREKNINLKVRNVFEAPTVSKLVEKINLAMSLNKDLLGSQSAELETAEKIVKRIVSRSVKNTKLKISTNKLVLKVD